MNRDRDVKLNSVEALAVRLRIAGLRPADPADAKVHDHALRSALRKLPPIPIPHADKQEDPMEATVTDLRPAEQDEEQAEDIVYIVAIRTRGDNHGQALREVLGTLSAIARSDPRQDYYATVHARPLSEAYHVEPVEEGKIRTVQNLNDALAAIGFTWDEANKVVPVVWESAPE